MTSFLLFLLAIALALFFKRSKYRAEHDDDMDVDTDIGFGYLVLRPDEEGRTSIPSFEELLACTAFERLTADREGAIVTDVREGDEKDRTSLVRSTSRYLSPTRPFHAHHRAVAEAATKAIGSRPLFDNAMIELYGPGYRKMGFHTDPALDLVPGSTIALFTLYENRNENENDMRKLVVKRKDDSIVRDIVLEHGSVVFFSTDANAEHVHKIVPVEAAAPNKEEGKGRWLGITLRCSRTWVDPDGYLLTDSCDEAKKKLRLATPEDERLFFRCRGIENREKTSAQHIYPYESIDFTLSPGDLLAAGSLPRSC